MARPVWSNCLFLLWSLCQLSTTNFRLQARHPAGQPLTASLNCCSHWSKLTVLLLPGRQDRERPINYREEAPYHDSLAIIDLAPNNGSEPFAFPENVFTLKVGFVGLSGARAIYLSKTAPVYLMSSLLSESHRPVSISKAALSCYSGLVKVKQVLT